MGALFSCFNSYCINYKLFAEDKSKRKLLSIEEQPELLIQPLNAVSIMSSHNSYVRTLQYMGAASTDGLRIALNKGARFLELDVFREKNDATKLFIAHGEEETPNDLLATTKLPLKDALDYIAKNAFVNTTDPLFLALELNMHSDARSCDALADELKFFFGSRLYNGKIFEYTPLIDLIGKVVLFSGNGTGGTKLDNLIHIKWNASFAFQNIPSSQPIESKIDRCVRVYPDGYTQGLLSLNYDPIPFLKAGVNYAAMNLCTNDSHTQAYEEWFGDSSFKLRSRNN